jgi:hypothetical protein
MVEADHTFPGPCDRMAEGDADGSHRLGAVVVRFHFGSSVAVGKVPILHRRVACEKRVGRSS